MPVTDQESERSCIYVLGVSILPLSTIYSRLDYGNVVTVWYFLFFILSLVNMTKQHYALMPMSFIA